MPLTSPAEEFFIAKIEEGLSYSSDALSEEEHNLLRAQVMAMTATPDFTPEKGQKLNAKCVGALSEAYARDTAGKKRDAALVWREHNAEIYKSSQLVISGIVQNWYLSVGRAQEKKGGGCLPVLIASVVLGSILLASIGLVAR